MMSASPSQLIASFFSGAAVNLASAVQPVWLEKGQILPSLTLGAAGSAPTPALDSSLVGAGTTLSDPRNTQAVNTLLSGLQLHVARNNDAANGVDAHLTPAQPRTFVPDDSGFGVYDYYRYVNDQNGERMELYGKVFSKTDIPPTGGTVFTFGPQVPNSGLPYWWLLGTGGNPGDGTLPYILVTDGAAIFSPTDPNPPFVSTFVQSHAATYNSFGWLLTETIISNDGSRSHFEYPTTGPYFWTSEFTQSGGTAVDYSWSIDSYLHFSDFDETAQNPWDRIDRVFDVIEGANYRSETVFWDDGTRSVHENDTTGVETWEWTRSFLDASGLHARTITRYDSGIFVSFEFDLADQAYWSSLLLRSNHEGKLSYIIAELDDGTYEFHRHTEDRDLVGTSGNDTLAALDSGMAVGGLAGKDTLTGGFGDDLLEGDGGNDVLFGGGGTNFLVGGTGNDTYWIDPQSDIVIEAHSGGTDTVYSRTTLVGPAEVEIIRLHGDVNAGATGTGQNNTIVGDASVNTINGAAGNDTLRGGAGNDELRGGNGSDRLEGDEGTDVLFGGASGDRFVFRKVGDSEPGSLRDRIADFVSGADRIDLVAIDADRTSAGNQAFTFVGALSFSGAAGEVRYANGLLIGNTDGDSAAEFSIRLSGSPILSVTDLLL